MKLKQLRKENGITQNKLASILGLSRSTIAMYETNASEPDLQTLNKIADFFGVSVDYLLERNDTNTCPENNKNISIPDKNTVIVLGRDNSGRTQFTITDKQREAIMTILETMKDIPEDDNF